MDLWHPKNLNTLKTFVYVVHQLLVPNANVSLIFLAFEVDI